MIEYIVKDRLLCKNWAIKVSDFLSVTLVETTSEYSPEPVIADQLYDDKYWKLFISNATLTLEEVDTVQNDVITLYNKKEDKEFILAVRNGTLALVLGTVKVNTLTYLTHVDAVKHNYPQLPAQAHDQLIHNLIQQNHARCEQYCGRHFMVADYTEYHDGNGLRTVLTKEYPINTVTSLHDDTDRLYEDGSLVSTTDYVVIGDQGKIILDGLIFGRGINNVKVIYNAGYTDVPEDLQRACEKLVAADIIENASAMNVVESDEVLYRPDKLRKEAFATLDKYKRYG